MRAVHDSREISPPHARADFYRLSSVCDRLRACPLPPPRFPSVVPPDHALGLSAIPLVRQISSQARRRRTRPRHVTRAHGGQRATLLYSEPDVSRPLDLSHRPFAHAPLVVRGGDHARDRDLVSYARFGSREKTFRAL